MNRSFILLAMESIVEAEEMLCARRLALCQGDVAMGSQLLMISIALRDSAVAALAADTQAGRAAAERMGTLMNESVSQARARR